MQPLADADSTFQQPFTRISSQIAASRLHELADFLLDYAEGDDARIRRTHFFGGRYENIYVDRSIHPTLDQLISQAQSLAAELLNISTRNLAVGFWLNIMPPGSSTTLHRHDDMDELLSAVFYLVAPTDSGHLEIHADGKAQNVEPIEGDFLFFSPRLPHAVSENRSQLTRLSLAMNFGPHEQQSD